MSVLHLCRVCKTKAEQRPTAAWTIRLTDYGRLWANLAIRKLSQVRSGAGRPGGSRPLCPRV